MKLIDNYLLNKITEKARTSLRLRMNYNLHDNLEAKAQRLLNALEPGTILPIHRHPHTAETYLIIRGRMQVIYYNDQKEETENIILDVKIGNYGIHIPAGQWHTLKVLESGTVIFEVKDGPYIPLDKKNTMNDYV